LSQLDYGLVLPLARLFGPFSSRTYSIFDRMGARMASLCLSFLYLGRLMQAFRCGIQR
jgi:hypothetical protein